MLGQKKATKNEAKNNKTVTQIVKENQDFSILHRALVRTGLDKALQETENLTVFAPNNAAFIASGLDQAKVNNMEVKQLTDVLKYHVLGTKVSAANILEKKSLYTATLEGKNIYVSALGSGKVLVNGIEVITADLIAKNGIIHVVNKVILPPTKTIAELATITPELTELLKAVVATDLTGVLADTKKYFTVFAPINAGFKAIESVTTTLTKQQLTDVLFAHLSEKVLFAGNINNQLELPTLNQSAHLVFETTPKIGVKIKEKNDKLFSEFVNNDMGLQVDIIATNGVIHLIHEVLVPKL